MQVWPSNELTPFDSMPAPNAAGRGSSPDGWDRQTVGRPVSCVYQSRVSRQSVHIAGKPAPPWRFVRLHHSDTTIIRSFPSLGCVKINPQQQIGEHRYIVFSLLCIQWNYTLAAWTFRDRGSKLLPGPFRLSGQSLHSYWPIIWKVLASLTLLPLPGFTHVDFEMDIRAS